MECKSIYKRDTCILMFTAALFTVAKLWNQPRWPTNELTVYAYHGILLSHKEKNEIMS
jgi:hypothetical protein